MPRVPDRLRNTLDDPTLTAEALAAEEVEDRRSYPALLVSYWYLKDFLRDQPKYLYRNWVMDSGAFSAHNSGVEINLQAYIDKCKELLATDPTLVEVYALDVIGDWKASLRNTEEMWRQGVEAVPCFHAGEPWDALIGMAKDYPKIALGGIALAKTGKKNAWAQQCFARVWPKRIHGFAFSGRTSVMGLPFASVDATNWALNASKWGKWKVFDMEKLSVRGKDLNLTAEIQWHLELEAKARSWWYREMRLLGTVGPTVRLAWTGQGLAKYLLRSNGGEE